MNDGNGKGMAENRPDGSSSHRSTSRRSGDHHSTGHPSTDNTEKQLAAIWAEVLSLESVEVDQNYFDLGGDSSTAVRMFAEIDKVFKVKLPLATLYETPTIEELARVLRGELASSGWSPLVSINPTGSRPPFFCFHGAGGNVLIYRDLARHLGPDQPF